MFESLCIVIRPELLKAVEETEETVTVDFVKDLAKQTGKSLDEVKGMLENSQKDYDEITPLE